MRRVRAARVFGEPPRPPEGAVRAERTPEVLIGQIFEAFDRAHGGFRGAPKFPVTAPLHLAVDLFRETQSADMAECVTRTLDSMGWGGLYDEEGGGFRRCAAAADWTDVQPEKLLVTNASLLDLYLEAGTAFSNERWLARAADVVEYLQGTLAIAPGEGWRLSEHNDATQYSDATALTASSLLRASTVFDDQSLRDEALQSLESAVLATYRPGHGVAHCRGGVRGLLADHVALISAHLDAWDLTSNVVYQMMAQELAHHMLRTLTGTPCDGFVDRATGDADDEIGLLAYPLRPFALNCDAAIALHRLAAVSPGAGFDIAARAALDSAAGCAAGQGPLAAHYVLAHRALSR